MSAIILPREKTSDSVSADVLIPDPRKPREYLLYVTTSHVIVRFGGSNAPSRVFGKCFWGSQGLADIQRHYKRDGATLREVAEQLREQL